MDDLKQVLQFGSFLICLFFNIVLSCDKIVKVMLKVMFVFVLLIDVQGEVLIREYLLDKLWFN